MVGRETPKQVGKQCRSLNQVEITTNTLVQYFFSIELDSNTTSKNLSEIDGDDSILYWMDLTSEIAFYLPQKFSSLFSIGFLVGYIREVF